MANKRIYITEEQFNKLLTEDVFIASKNNSTKKAQLKYNKNQSYNKGNLNPFDKLKTDKMDNTLSNDTYQIPLKGGLMSYNITDIKGSEVMHYFKRIFDKQQTIVKLENDETQTNEQYELEMQDSEFADFMNQFKNKVSTVINFQINQFYQSNPKIKFNNISIYPVPSSSKFNIEMAKRLQYLKLFGLTPSIVNSSLLQKNLKNLNTDDDFINKNTEYYNSPLNTEKFGSASHLDNVQTVKNKFDAYQELQKRVDTINLKCKKLLEKWQNRAALQNGFTKSYLDRLYEIYNDYISYIPELKNQNIKYQDLIYNIDRKLAFGDSVSQLKYSKGPSIEKRSNAIYNLLKDYGYMQKHKGKNTIPLITYYELKPFEIKKLSNDARMGLKNYFQPNADEKLVKKETEKAQETILIVFDDNISGGATLSDICEKLKELGFNYIIPITFGTMHAQYNRGIIPISKPENNEFNY